MRIEKYAPSHRDAVVELSLRAWQPVFASMRDGLDREVYDEFYPEGWRPSQEQAVGEVCDSAEVEVWVAVVDGEVAGFTALKLDADSKMGEIYMIAVDPRFQKRGIGAALTDRGIERMQAAGMSIAMVETGADPGHGPARRTYEKAGFGLWPVARYFRKL